MADLLAHDQELVTAKQQQIQLKENCEEMRNKRDELTVTLTLKGNVYDLTKICFSSMDDFI